MSEENEWELSKENVQPIRQGRHFSNLSASLQSSEDQLAQIRKEKQQFEDELRTYSGEDPLEVWYRYLVWTEQNCVKGGKENNLEKLLENYLKQFTEEKRYHNDPRYVSAWIRYANMCKDPSDIFNYMFDQKIGNELSCFYESWAWILEQMGNTKKANLIYQEGIKRRSEPMDLLERKYNNFQMRVARGLAGKIMDDAPEESVEKRAALGQLKTMSRKVPVNRADNTALKPRGLGLQSIKPAQVGQSFQIFNDENQDPSLPGQQGDWSDVPTKAAVNKENERKAGVWSKAKIPCKTVAPPPTPSFTPFIDETADQPMATPRKLPEVGNQVLSARKPLKHTDNLHNLRHETNDPTQRSMYCKDKVYCGAEEYSLEEIRAAKWFSKKKKEEDKRRLEEEQQLIDEQREQLRRNQLMLQQEAEQFRMRQQTLQQEHQAILEQCKSEIQRQQEEFKREREMMIQQQKEILEKEIEERMNAGLAAAGGSGNREKSSSKQLNFVEMNESSSRPTQNSILQTQSPLETLSKKPLTSLSDMTDTKVSPSVSYGYQENSLERPSQQCTVPSISFQSEKPSLPNVFQPRAKQDCSSVKPAEEVHPAQGHLSFSEVQNNSHRTPINKSMAMSSAGGRNSGGRQSMSEPSPTVNTKEAMQLVMGMFNASLAIDANLGWEDDDDDNMVTAPPVSQAPVSNAPFTIFTDDQMDTGERNENAVNRLSNKSTDFIGQRKKGLNRGGQQSVCKDNFETMEYEGKMEAIESQARDDITICPIGTNQSFAAAARVASTPFNRDKTLDSLSDVSRISAHSDAKTSLQIYTDSHLHTSKEEIKDLSPIMEGSNEESSGNHGQSTVNSVFIKSHTSHVAMDTDFCDLPKFEDLNQSTHVIDITKYTPSPSIHLQIKPRNPFDENDIDKFLHTSSPPLESKSNYYERDELLPEIRVANMIDLGQDTFIAEELVGKGGYAKVYKISSYDYLNEYGEDSPETLALKVQSPPCPWEFYICNELQNRLTQINNPVDITPAMMNARKGYFFNNCSCILTDYHAQGTLLDLVNKLTKSNSTVGEALAMYVTIEMLYMIEYLHKCQIIHGDVKPDNFLLIDIPKLKSSTDPTVVFGGASRCMQLIDFGQSIDMSKYPKGTTFMAKVKTSGFQCIEMQTDRPWTYQTDLFGLVGTIHVLVFRKYMQVYQSYGEWKITSSLVRSWNVPLWKKLFHECLNIPSCEEIPDISVIRKEFEEYFCNNLLDKYNSIQNALSLQLL
ncbi:mitotic checkpoint serine/threonine-protein kinase BUB1-like [Mytilus trossulus]|uniref:mitotic checkpoint serine/threonine-protein kinase BUB1-like n=1 Tax=Mytilus trossulus TaxID=6551 RepID=UPI003006E31C